MQPLDWVQEFPAAVTVCDAEGVILAMNAKAATSFADSGGAELIGSNLLDCHPEPARAKLRDLLLSGRANVYTIEKNGIRKLIYQSPWYVDGDYRGLVELSFEIPDAVPHFIR
jgi:hypothetical protein